MKFSNELEAQLIPEWKAAFVNYRQLKKHVEEIKLLRKPKQPQQVDRNFGWSSFDPIRSMAKKAASKFQKSGNATVIIQNSNLTKLTFCVAGFFTASFFTLFSIYAILIHVTGIFYPTPDTAYVETVYPIFSIFTLWSLHLFMYGCNLFLWKSTRINHNFIFDFSSSTALEYRDAFLICATFMTTVVGAMIVHLLLCANGSSSSLVNVIPVAPLLIFFVVLACPNDKFYRSTLVCFIRVMRNIIFSPFYKVLMVDVFMADQLTSQIPVFRHMGSSACYFLARSFKTHQYATCKTGRLYGDLAYVISLLPCFWRVLQCARRWLDERDTNHLANMGKYVSAMAAVGVRITYARHPNCLWLGMVLVTSVVATVYQLYWDFVKDWGFLKLKSRNLWLRDDLVLEHKCIYYISIALNVVLRVAWVETVLSFNVGAVESRLLDFFLASLEVIRRGHWNFYRLENEHLNNVRKFRAVKTVLLPFREMDPLRAKSQGGMIP
ncbi:hypothetical protein EUGRSUZ_H00142 [Eucalyptus grandis]|uniref:Uncharacterized protein n=1 Tax=Eucalyptus grandis TaxID=71139 RepID=A0ACC3JL70_EUCGR|nr:hypothetical protein EUGRSUZ_H00142 [Eucalyptus grandis]